MVAESKEKWFPGSFTKNFSWGSTQNGLKQLYEAIKIGFDDSLEDVPRETFRKRVADSGKIDYIPANFFLFNTQRSNQDWLVADELVFQALSFPHSSDFDKLALFAFNLSMVGKWHGARKNQRRPTLWSKYYLIDRVGRELDWNTDLINANDIESFFIADSRYSAKTTRKVSTNLNRLFKNGKIDGYSSKQVERWWVSALFLALDRAIEDNLLDGRDQLQSEYGSLLTQTKFHSISGKRSLEKDLAASHLVALYTNCGARGRFNEDIVAERTVELTDQPFQLPNSEFPFAAIHPTNPRLIKILPRFCAMLAAYSGFEQMDLADLEQLDVKSYISSKTKQALDLFKQKKYSPKMSAEELMEIMRGK